MRDTDDLLDTISTGHGREPSDALYFQLNEEILK